MESGILQLASRTCRRLPHLPVEAKPSVLHGKIVAVAAISSNPPLKQQTNKKRDKRTGEQIDEDEVVTTNA